tara:strand:+ start:187 stop:426 length:240 start_codon:yes stop_codon:yes gene_type:complete
MKILVTSFFILFVFLHFVALSEYKYTEDSFPKDGVSKGKIIKKEFAESKIYPGTVRDYWIYVPDQCSMLTWICRDYKKA